MVASFRWLYFLIQTQAHKRYDFIGTHIRARAASAEREQEQHALNRERAQKVTQRNIAVSEYLCLCICICELFECIFWHDILSVFLFLSTRSPHIVAASLSLFSPWHSHSFGSPYSTFPSSVFSSFASHFAGLGNVAKRLKRVGNSY